MTVEADTLNDHRLNLALRRLPEAAAVALAVLAALLVTALGGPLGALPAYLATILAFAIFFVLPGVVVARALLPEMESLVHIAIAPALALGMMAAPGFVSLELHLTLTDFAIMYALVAAVCCGLAYLLVGETAERDTDGSDTERGHLLLAGLIGIALVGVVTTPFWAEGRLSGDFDDWTYASYVREYMDTDGLNAEEPFFNTGGPVNPRMRTNVWVLSEALIADAADVPPVDLLQEFLPPLITLMAVLAAYAFSRSLFRSALVGLIAAALFLGQALIDLTPHEGFGRNLFLRVSEDKMVGGFLVFPVILLFVERAVSVRSLAAIVGFMVCVLAQAVVHPMPLFFTAAAVAVMAGLRWWGDRSLEAVRVPALLLGIIALVSIWPFTQREDLADTVPSLFATGEAAGQFRNEFHVIELGAGWLIGNYHMILHPFVLATIGLTPLLWLALRRTAAGQLLTALTVAALLLLFLPLLATPIAEVMAPSTLWRVPWMVPIAPVMGYFAFRIVRRSFALLPPRWLPTAGTLVPSLTVVLMLIAGLVVQDQYLRFDDRNFYERASRTTLVPGTGGSIFLGGVDRSFTKGWRVNGQEQRLLSHIERTVPDGSTVVTESERVNLLIPAYFADIYPFASTIRTIYPRGTAEMDAIAKEEQAFGRFYRGEISPEAAETAFQTYGVDYVVLTLGSAADAILRSFDTLRPGDFTPAGGTPDLAMRPAGYEAWSMAPSGTDRLIATFTTPDAEPNGDSRLGVDLVFAPSTDVDRSATARFRISYAESGLPPVATEILDGNIDANTSAGVLLRGSRELPGEMAPGTTYQVTIERLGDGAGDSYREDIWLVATSLKYRPPGTTVVAGTNFLLYRVP